MMLKDLELIAFWIVFVGLILVSGFIPQTILDKWEIAILLFVLTPLLAWGGRLILKGRIS